MIGVTLSELKNVETTPKVNYIFKDNESGVGIRPITTTNLTLYAHWGCSYRSSYCSSGTFSMPIGDGARVCG